MAAIGYFKNAVKADIGNVPVTIYQAPADKTSYLIELDISAKGDSGVQVSVQVVDTSAAVTAYVVKSAPIPPGSSLQVIDGQKIVLESTDQIIVVCETPGEDVDAILSLVEDVNA